MVVTEFQEKVYALLQQIPAGRLSSYAALARALETSPRAIGNALAKNPFAPEVPCHRVIAVNGYVNGYNGECKDRASGVNQKRKLELLTEEGVMFDEGGMLVGRADGKRMIDRGKEKVWFDGPWKL